MHSSSGRLSELQVTKMIEMVGGERMIGVKITVLLVVVTVIWYFVSRMLVSGESMETKIRLAMNNELTWYMVVFVVLVIASVLGVLYSMVYFLFLR